MSHTTLAFMLSASAVAIMASAAPHAANAQTQATDAASGLEEITVTARKRSETLLQVPVSVVAFDSQRIQEEGIFNLNDVAALTPGFQIDNQGGATSRNDRSTQTLIVRGMTPGQSPTTSVFIDGAPVTSGFVDGVDGLERAEILKGPQSAYFGRATFAGAVNLITKKPSDDLKLSADALFGSYNWHDVRVTAEGAIAPGILSIRASVRDYAESGQYTNHGDKGGTLGDQSTKSANLAVAFTPTDNLSMNLFGLYWHDSDGPSATGIFSPGHYNCSTGSATPKGTLNYFCGGLPGLATSGLGADTNFDSIVRTQLISNALGLYRPLYGPDQATGHGGLERDAYHLHGEISYAIPDWGITITSLSAANSNHYSVLQDLDNTPSTGIPNPYYGVFGPAVAQYQEKYSNWIFAPQFKSEDVSQELRVTSSQDQPFRWLVGLNYFHALSAQSLGAQTPFGTAVSFSTLPSPIYEDTYAVFGSMTYDVTENLNISFDARYQEDHQETYSEHLTGPDTFFGSANFRNFIPRVITQYKIDSDVQVYASWSRGTNVGFLNNTLIGLPASVLADVQKNYGATLDVLPEDTEQYELGIKGRFWDNRITVSTDIYAGTWTNQIASLPIFYALNNGATNMTTAFVNIGKTDLFGWEFEGAIKPIEHLVINGAASFAKTDVRNYVCSACIAIDGSAVVKGNQLPDYPAWQANVGVEWSDELPMMQSWNYYGRAEAIYNDKIYVDYTNLTWDPASIKFNFRAGLKSDSYSLEAFVLNAFDDNSYASVNQGVSLFSPGFSALAIVVGLPQLRTFGVRLKYTFDAGHVTPPQPAAYVPPPVVAPAPTVARSYMVFFDFNKSDLTAQAATIVDAAARNAGPAKVTEIEVTGHTDTVGSDEYNIRLSRRRADAVAAELEKQGIPSNEIAVFAKGKKDLLVPTADGVRQPQNRRVQIVYSSNLAS